MNNANKLNISIICKECRSCLDDNVIEKNHLKSWNGTIIGVLKMYVLIKFQSSCLTEFNPKIMLVLSPELHIHM
jgi:hypothetical protein